MNGTDTAAVQSVTRHLADLYLEDSPDAFFAEIDIFLQRVRELTGDDRDRTVKRLCRLGDDLLRHMGFREADLAQAHGTVCHELSRSTSVADVCARFRRVMIRVLNGDPSTGIPEASSPSTAEDFVEAIEQYLNSCSVHTLRAIGEDQLADQFEVPGDHLYRCYRRVRGRPLDDAIRSARLSRAIRMLSDDRCDLPVSDVVQMVGFGSIGQFRMAFRAHYTGRTDGDSGSQH